MINVENGLHKSCDDEHPEMAYLSEFDPFQVPTVMSLCIRARSPYYLCVYASK